MVNNWKITSEVDKTKIVTITKRILNKEGKHLSSHTLRITTKELTQIFDNTQKEVEHLDFLETIQDG